MLEIFAERGGDPDRPGKEHPLDCLLWQRERAGRARVGQPVRPRPARLAHRVHRDRARPPRRRRSTCRAAAATSPSRTTRWAPPRRTSPPASWPYAPAYAHAGMVRLDGEKMSKSRGNLVFVSRLRAAGHRPGRDPARDPRAPLPHATGTGPTRASPRPRPARPPGAPRSAAPRPRRRPTPCSRRCAPASPTTSTPPGALAAVDRWAEATRLRGGAAGAEDPRRVRSSATSPQALLGVAL